MFEVVFGIFWGVSIAVIFVYIILIRRYIRVWDKLPEWRIPENWQPETAVSIIIPVRNEALGIEACLKSVLQQNYPPELMEIIVVDDHSTDGTESVVQILINKKDKCSPPVSLLKLSELSSPQQPLLQKKAALTAGISKAKGKLIITTDGDCIVPQNWLNYLVSYHEINKTIFIAAPVNFHREKKLLEKFQSLDYMGMMLITGAGIHGEFGWMSNGANLAYPKQLFLELNGFEGIDHIASGDDMLFMQKVAERYPDRIGFVKSKEATVLSIAKNSWPSFFQQRIRWAGKTAAYRQPQLVFTQSVVFVYCALLLMSIPMIIFLKWNGLILFLSLFLVKYIADYFLLRKASRFFNRSELMNIFPVAEWVHTAYIFLTGLLSVFKKEHLWKGRRVH